MVGRMVGTVTFLLTSQEAYAVMCPTIAGTTLTLLVGNSRGGGILTFGFDSAEH